MHKEGIRLYIMGIICILITMNIPEISFILRDKFNTYSPQITETIKANYNDISAAIVPLVGKIGGVPKIFVNGKAENVDTSDDFSLEHGQSLSKEQIDTILMEVNSPAEGTGQYWIKYGVENDIDAAYGLAIFYQESGLGTNENWYLAGYNTGNIICAGYWHCQGRFRDYSKDANPWASSIVDVFKLLRSYRNGGIDTFDAAIMKWAPPVENNTEGYISNTKTLIRAWRNTNKLIAKDGYQAISAPILANNDSAFGWNVKAALDANNGALRSFVIRDSEQWSFNETMENVPESQLKVIVNPGDGWCDLACRYVQVFKGLGLRISHSTIMDSNDIVFLQHGGIALNSCTYDESPYIWSNGTKGFDKGLQDLIINNRTGKTITINVIENNDGTVSIVGRKD